MEKQNLTEQKHAFTNQNKCMTTQNKHKLEAKDVLSNINRMHAAERAQNAIFVHDDLDI